MEKTVYMLSLSFTEDENVRVTFTIIRRGILLSNCTLKRYRYRYKFIKNLILLFMS